MAYKGDTDSYAYGQMYLEGDQNGLIVETCKTCAKLDREPNQELCLSSYHILCHILDMREISPQCEPAAVQLVFVLRIIAHGQGGFHFGDVRAEGIFFI